MPKDVFKQMKEIFTTKYCNVQDLCGSKSWFDSGLCVKFEDGKVDEYLDDLPTIKIVLADGFVIELTARDYLLKYNYDGKLYRCLGMMYMSLNEFIFGNTLMLKYSTVYDRENSKLGIGLRADSCLGTEN